MHSSSSNSNSTMLMPGGQQHPAADGKRRNRGGANHDPGLYDLPSFYSSDYVGSGRTEIPSIETGGQSRVRASTPFRPSADDKEDSGESSFARREFADGDAAGGGGAAGLYRNKCVSFLALVAGLAAFGCSLASLAGTTNWVDTWEPIDLPPTQDWPLLFGTGYGSLMPSRSKDGQSGKATAGGSSAAGGGGHSNVKSSWSASTSSTKVAASGFANGADPTATKSNWESSLRPSAPGGGHQHVGPSAENVTTTSPSLPAAVTTTTARPATSDADEFDYDDDDYYAQDESYQAIQGGGGGGMKEPDDAEIVMLRHEEEEQQQNPEDEQEDEQEDKRSLVVVFHVGLFRACPVLKGEMPSSVVLPNLPCAPLEYINWRPLTGQSFRLWRNVEYTPDFLNKLRYATPCFVLGTFIGLVALIIAIGGRCTGPDRTLVCSSLHILAGLSLGSGLIIFVSVLHEEFSLPSLRSSRHSGGWPPASSPSNRFYNGDSAGIGGAGPGSAFYSDSRSLLTATTATGGQHSVASSSAAGGGSGLVSAALIPSFRYGWSFYAALAAFVSSELAAAVYIILHTHIFKWASRTRSAAQAAANSSGKLLLMATNSLASSTTAASVCKEIGVQTSPLSSASLLMMMDKRSSEVSAISPTASAIADVSHHSQQMHVPYCDLLTMDPGHSTAHGEFDRDPDVPPFLAAGAGGRPSPMYINNAESGPGIQQEMDCTCQIHYATYNRPKMRNSNHVAGIHRASTMPRKVAFEGLANVYQQTPL